MTQHRRVAVLVGLAALGVVAVLAFFVLPDALVSERGLTAEQELKAESDVRTAGLQLLAGLVLAIGASFAAVDVGLNRQRQLTDRFASAIELLGHDRVEVRAGSAYALERIALDSGRDHPAIVLLLAAFIRERAPLALDRSLASSADERPRPPADIQAAVSVLGRRKTSQDDARTEVRLSRTNLRGANLRAGHFEGVRLRSADLDHAHLEGATLVKAELRGASLRLADLSPQPDLGLGAATLRGASLNDAVLAEADLRGVDLSGADLSGADFQGARYDMATRWPVGFDPTKAGCVLR
jgi:hypothetical protein